MREKIKRNLWTDEESLRARQLMDKKANDAEFQRVLGRSKSSAVCRLKYLDDPLERNRRNELRAGYNSPASGNCAERKPDVTERARAEANERAMAPRTITGWFCGDPPPGFSALDRRQA